MFGQSVEQSTGQSGTRAGGQSTTQSVEQSVTQTLGQTATQPQIKPYAKPFGQSPAPQIPASFPVPKDITLNYAVGDYVSQVRYGTGCVTDIRPSGADYEVTVEFGGVARKFMSGFAKLTKVENE